jgi:CheY-like chemotaxis protein/HPt (histidine-containing phosphotransfer) domain-containing protein
VTTGPVVAQVPTLLLVEDDDSIREIVSEVLSSRGYEVLTAGNGRIALDVLHRRADSLPRLILLDLMMPDMDGRQFLAERRKEPQLVPIPVIVLTAAGRTQVSPELDVAAWLSKPVELDRLLATVAQYVPAPRTKRSPQGGGERVASSDRIGPFLERRRRELVTLREALASDDSQEIRGIGHNLKGVGAGFGYPQIGDFGARLEKAAIDRDAEAMRAVIDELGRFLDAPPPPAPV